MRRKAATPPAKGAFAHNRSVMGMALRDADWQASPLGPIAGWPTSLKTAVGLVLDSAGTKILVWGPELVTFYNDAYIPLLAGAPNDGMGRSYPGFRPDLWVKMRPHLEAAMAGEGQGATQMRTVLRRNGDEETAYYTLCFNPVRDEQGAVAGVLTDFIETTAHVRLADALLAENKRFRALFDQAPVFLALTATADLRIEYVNRAYERLVGARDMVGKTAAEALPELEAQGFIKLLAQVYQSGEPQIGRDTAFQPRNEAGEVPAPLYLDFIYQPIVDAGGAVTGVLCVGSDVTERHVAMAQAERLESDLHHASRMSAMGTMATTIAHELNQPLTAAGNYLSGCRRMVESLEGPGRATLQGALDRAEQQVRRAGEIVSRARTIVVSDSARHRVVSMNDMVAHAIELVAATRGCGAVEIRSCLSSDDTLLCVDPVQIEQVLLNLMRNACQAMASSKRRELTISSRELGDGFAEIFLQDTGCGLPGDAEGDVFAAFVKSTTGGLGVGLSLSRTLVEAHGGTMSASNNPDGGASFRFTLPMAGALMCLS